MQAGSSDIGSVIVGCIFAVMIIFCVCFVLIWNSQKRYHDDEFTQILDFFDLEDLDDVISHLRCVKAEDMAKALSKIKNISKDNKTLLRRLHVKEGEEVFGGAKAFLILWKKMPKYKFLYTFFKLPIIFGIFLKGGHFWENFCFGVGSNALTPELVAFMSTPQRVLHKDPSVACCYVHCDPCVWGCINICPAVHLVVRFVVFPILVCLVGETTEHVIACGLLTHGN